MPGFGGDVPLESLVVEELIRVGRPGRYVRVHGVARSVTGCYFGEAFPERSFAFPKRS